MIQGKTKSGFAYALDKDILNNMELVDALAEMQEENPLSVSQVLNLILGKEQKQRLYDHVRTDSGRVPMEKITEELGELFSAFGQPGKNC